MLQCYALVMSVRVVASVLVMICLLSGCGGDTQPERDTGEVPAASGAQDSGTDDADGGTGAAGIEGGAAPTVTCDAQELAAACDGRECGASIECGQSCGACPNGAMCEQGLCVTPEEACATSPETCECLPLDFAIPTRQSCAIDASAAIDGEGFIEVDGGTHRVLAINRWGEGHLIAWCDASMSDELLMSFPALPYLGRSASPRFASFGNPPMCDGDFGVQTFEVNPVYLGNDLPDKYLGDPAGLAADYDVLMVCGAYTAWKPEWAALLQAYVTEQGKGLFVVMDYQGWDHTLDDFDQMNAVIAPSGIAFDPVDLSWADASVNVGVECLPDLTEAVLQ